MRCSNRSIVIEMTDRSNRDTKKEAVRLDWEAEVWLSESEIWDLMYH